MSAGELKEYTVEIDGVEHTLLLDQADAEKRGLVTASNDEGVDIDALVAERTADLEAEHETAFAELEAAHKKAITDLKAELDSAHGEAISELKADHESALEAAVEKATADALAGATPSEPGTPAAKTRGTTAK